MHTDFTEKMLFLSINLLDNKSKTSNFSQKSQFSAFFRLGKMGNFYIAGGHVTFVLRNGFLLIRSGYISLR